MEHVVSVGAKFSLDGKLFALIDDQGLLKVWHTETNELKQEFTPNLHLASPCTSLIWLSVSVSNLQASTRKKAKLKKKYEGANLSLDSLYIALGTSKGNVALYSFSQAMIDRNLKGEGHNGKITNLCYDSNDLLYTCGEDCRIIAWSTSKEKQISSWSIGNEIPYSISYLKKSQNILIGGKELKLFSIKEQELIQNFIGHTSEIILLNTFIYEDNEYAITGSRLERILCIWDIHSKRKIAICSFLMEDVAQSINCILFEDSELLKLIAVTRSGVTHVYSVNLVNIKSKKPVKPNVTIEIASDNKAVIEPIQIIAANIELRSQSEKILLCYGDKNFLVFEEIDLNYSEKKQVLLRSNPKQLLTKLGKKQKKNDKNLKTLIPVVNENVVEYQPITTGKKKAAEQFQIPMETRFQNLYLNNGDIPKAHSKVQLLIQALHSKDNELLMTVLTSTDPKVINLTLQKLPVKYVDSLVNELTLLMERKRLNVQISATWLKVLIKLHSSQLMALGHNELLEKFGPCIGIIEHRLNCLKELSKLNGRLQLLVSQIKRNNEEDNFENQNVLVYEDKDSSDLDSEKGLEDSNESSSSPAVQYDNWDDEDDDVDENMEI